MSVKIITLLAQEIENLKSASDPAGTQPRLCDRVCVCLLLLTCVLWLSINLKYFFLLSKFKQGCFSYPSGCFSQGASDLIEFLKTKKFCNLYS